MSNDIYQSFLEQHDYDVRKTNDARWIDQKCTFDVINIISDCILEYIGDDLSNEFTISDIWHNEYTRENVIEIFSKSDPELKAENEYDKYFSQPIKLLSYSKVLNVRKEKNKYYFSVNNIDILEKIALRPTNALNFLFNYISKVLSDSNIMNLFDDFFNIQTKESYKNLKDSFIRFTIKNTNINGDTECGRIFTKIINPLAFKLKKKGGTQRGRILKSVITLNDLQYNRSNWRDELSGKEKFITRSEHEPTVEQFKARAMANYTINKAKKAVHKFNDKYFNSKSEILQPNEIVNATQAHHIFAQADFPSIADFVENLIMLTPNQHFSMAHPNNNTQYIDKDFQYICLISKSTTIYKDLMNESNNKLYDFDDYKIVLNTGLETQDFSKVEYLDFASIVDKIDYFYTDFIEENKYKDLIKTNKLTV